MKRQRRTTPGSGFAPRAVVESLECRVFLHAGHAHVIDPDAVAATYGLGAGIVPWLIPIPVVSQPGPHPDPGPGPGPGPVPDPDPDPAPGPDPNPGPDPAPDPDPDPTPGPDPNPVDRFTQVSWTARASGPIGRSEALTATVGGKVYVFGGFSGALGPVTRSDVYDPVANAWAPIRDLPERTTHAGVATSGRDVYLVGGYIGRPGQTGYGQTFGSRSVWRYNVDADAYTPMTPLPAPYSGGGAVIVNSKLHYFGGYNLNRTDTDIHLVLDLANPAAGWKSAASMPMSRNHMGYVNFGDKIYAIAGQTGTDEGLVTQRDVQIYDPATDTWTQGAKAPKAVSHISSATFVMGGRIVIAGGESGHGRSVRDVFAYTPSTNSWATLTSLPAPRFSGVATSIGGRISFTTGSNTTTTWEGTPL